MKQKIEIDAEFPPKLAGLFQPARYKILYGGRGGAKSWSIARALLLMGQQEVHRILECREFQQSLQDSTWRLLADQVFELGLNGFYEIAKGYIRGANGTEFRFAGIAHNVQQIKSFEGITICHVAEAANVSKYSWETLIPTIRRPNSEIWIDMNPELETDYSYTRWIKNPPPDAKLFNIGWRENPWFPDVLRREMEECKASRYEDYLHIWEGQPRRFTEGAIYLRELQQAEQEGRITSVPYDPHSTVHAFFDLGRGDFTACWLVQRCGFETHVIDFFQDTGKVLDHYLKLLANMPFPIAHVHLPHDAKAKHLGTKQSVEEMMRTHHKTTIVPNLSVPDGIQAVRALFPSLWIDKTKCADGIDALRHYRFELESDDKGGYRPNPVHDRFSHASDAMRYLAVGLRGPKGKPDFSKYNQQRQKSGVGSNHWMTT